MKVFGCVCPQMYKLRVQIRTMYGRYFDDATLQISTLSSFLV